MADNKVLITVSGGVASMIDKPEGTIVEIRDYDVEGVDVEDSPRCKKDNSGDWYQEIIWD